MILVIVGSQKFPFDRLIRAVDQLVESGDIQEDVFAQIGTSEYVPKHMKYERYLDKRMFEESIANCDILISHSGVGSVMKGLICKKRVIAVPRYGRFNEHVDDHQLMIARVLAAQNYLFNVEDIAELGDAIARARTHVFEEYHTGANQLMDTLTEFIDR